MIEIGVEDDLLTALEGLVVSTGGRSQVEYKLVRVLGAGTFSVAFYAVRKSAEGESPVVLKVMRPRMMRADGSMMALVAQKERVALERLNERVPATPFVVRLFDSAVLRVTQGGIDLGLPWLAIEYVHGGAEGTTLEERIDFTVERTGSAFDPARAALALRCLAAGLEAVHGVGVVHRDITPWNVLCCGFGHTEVFKISDFGIARPLGHRGTFEGSSGGTAGYAPPEQVVGDKDRISQATDVFALAATLFRTLTAENYFRAGNTMEGVLLAERPERRRLRDCLLLSPDLRGHVSVCKRIDEALTRATQADPSQRPDDVWEFATPILEALSEVPSTVGLPQRRVRPTQATAPGFSWVWRVRNRPGDDRVVRSVAWDGDGSALVATASGLEFWDGTRWHRSRPSRLPVAEGIRFVRRMRAGLWLVGGDTASIAVYTSEGVASVIRGADPDLSFVHASGDIDELAVFVGIRVGDPPALFTLAEGHWLEPLALPKAASVTAIARLAPDRWLLCGRSRAGDGYTVTYAPRGPELKRLVTTTTRAFMSCAAVRELQLGIVVGACGRAIRIEGGQHQESLIGGEPDLSAAAVDASGRAYAATTGSIWIQRDPQSWSAVWRDPSFSTPFISLFADVGLVIGMTADGGVIEGRWEVDR